MSLTARQVIEQARIRHWSFVDVGLSDGAAVLWLNQRQRHLLLRYHDQLRGQVGASMQVAATISGSLVGLSAGGTPYYMTSVGDGNAVHLSDGGTPYIETTEAPITNDPFGSSGGTPGWPLPTDAISLLAMAAIDANGTASPITIIDEAQRTARPQRRLMAFLSGNRVVPIRPSTIAANNSSDDWSTVANVQLSYVPFVSLSSLDDTLTFPTPLHEALIAGMADMLAKQARQCTVAERQMFAADAQKAETEITTIGFDVAGDIKTASVSYRG